MVRSLEEWRRGRAFYEHACGLKLEGIVSKRGDAPYAPWSRFIARW